MVHNSFQKWPRQLLPSANKIVENTGSRYLPVLKIVPRGIVPGMQAPDVRCTVKFLPSPSTHNETRVVSLRVPHSYDAFLALLQEHLEPGEQVPSILW